MKIDCYLIHYKAAMAVLGNHNTRIGWVFCVVYESTWIEGARPHRWFRSLIRSAG